MYPSTVFQAATIDRKRIFVLSEGGKDLEIAVLFSNPYSLWKWGSNENGLPREFPKKNRFKTCFTNVIKSYIAFINQKPRKCLV